MLNIYCCANQQSLQRKDLEYIHQVSNKTVYLLGKKVYACLTYMKSFSFKTDEKTKDKGTTVMQSSSVF